MNPQKKLITFLHDHHVPYKIKKHELDNLKLVIHSEKQDRHIEIELYEGGYNLHFSIENFYCFDQHDFFEELSGMEENLIDFISQIIREDLVGIKIEYAGSVRDLFCRSIEINALTEKRIASLKEKDSLKGKQYKFSIRSFKGIYDKDIKGEI